MEQTTLKAKVIGANISPDEFIYLNLGFGLGGYMFVRGKEHLGANGFAGEIGHTCVKDGGRQCECGLKGCLQTLANSPQCLPPS